MPTIYFPVMWFSLEVEATEKFVNDLKKFLSLPNVCVYTGVIMILVGSLIILTMVILYLLKRQRATSIAIDKVSGKYLTQICVQYLRSLIVLALTEREARDGIGEEIGTGLLGQE